MKTPHLVLTACLMLATATISAKTLVITVQDVRNDKGSILVMATAAGQERPYYAMTAAQAGSVTVTIEGIDDSVGEAEISLFHDEDSNYQMKMGDHGPAEGYASKKYELTTGHDSVGLKLHYPGPAASCPIASE